MNSRLANKISKKGENLSVEEVDQASLISNDKGLNIKVFHLQNEVATLKDMLSKLIGRDQISDVLVNKITISPSDDFIGTNWHPFELSEAGIELRWTGPGALATIKLPLLRNEKLKGSFSIFNQKNGHNSIDKIRIFVDGDEVIPLSKDLEVIEFIIPAQKYVFSYTEIGILTDGTYQVKNTEGNVIDSRWLGCAFKELSISK